MATQLCAREDAATSTDPRPARPGQAAWGRSQAAGSLSICGSAGSLGSAAVRASTSGQQYQSVRAVG